MLFAVAARSGVFLRFEAISSTDRAVAEDFWITDLRKFTPSNPQSYHH